MMERKRLRLENYDYSQNGYYHITICTKDKKPLFGRFVGNGLDRSVVLTEAGRTVEQHLLDIPKHFCHVSIIKHIIMPNHVHMILSLDAPACTERSRPFPTVSTVIGLLKSGVSRAVGFPVWQKSFYDHVIRDERDFLETWNYIDGNPQK